jgi:hypothetical protein
MLDPAMAKLSDRKLFLSGAIDSPFNELRCQGFGPKATSVIYERRFGERERRVRAALIAKYGVPKEGENDFLPIGKKCPAYKGAMRRYEGILAELETRLGLTSR